MSFSLFPSDKDFFCLRIDLLNRFDNINSNKLLEWKGKEINCLHLIAMYSRN